MPMPLFSDQPQSVLGVIDGSLKIYRSVFLKTLPFSLLYAIIAGFPSLVFFHIVASPPAHSILFLSGISIFCALINLFLMAVIYFRIYLDAMGNARGYGASFKMAFRKYPVYLITSVVYFIINLVGFIFFVFPGLFFAVYFCFYFVAILFDQADVIESLRRSASLVKFHWWRTFCVMAIPLVALVLTLKIVEWFSGIRLVFLTHLPALEKAVHGHLITFIVMAVLMPWFFSVMLCQYHDLKLRHSALESSH